MTDYAKNNYLDPNTLKPIESQTQTGPTPPYAMTKVIRGEDGLMHTTYINPDTGETLQDLKGYTVLDAGGGYYKVTTADDINKDGNVNPQETQTHTKEALGHTTREDAQGHTPGPKGTASNNYGYHEKPSWLGAASTVAGMVNPGIGAIGKTIGLGYNVGNMEAVNTARKSLGLSALTGRQMAKGAFKDNSGQVARVGIGDKNYSVGLDAMDTQGRTNMTPTEATKHALANSQNIHEVADPKVAATEESPQAPKGPISKALSSIGLERGFATKAMNTIFGKTPDTAPTPSSKTTTVTDTGVGTSTPSGVAAASHKIDKTAGLANLEGSVNGVGLISDLSGPNKQRPNMPSENITGKIQQAVAETFGPGYSVSVYSGQEDPGKQFGSTRHKTGLAADVDVVDPSGKKVTDVNALNDMASKFAFDNPNAGIGFGTGYMAPGRMHLDVTGQAKQWGAKNTIANMDPALSETIDAARLGYQPTPFSNAPSPTPSPGISGGFVSQDERSAPTGNVANAQSTTTNGLASGQVPDNVGAGTAPSHAFQSQDEKANTGNVSGYHNNFTSQDERSSLPDRMGITDAVGDSLNPGAHVSALSPNGSQVNTTKAVNTDSSLGTSPAARAAMGLTNRTPAEKAQMAKAIAGELSQSSLAGLKKSDPEALAELGNMVATMENRAASVSYTGISKTLNPTQYNSLMESNTAVTNQNYAANKKALDAALGQYYSGAIPGVNYSATSYYNPDIANPDWASQVQNPAQVGAHVFGSLPEYGESKAAKEAAKAMEHMIGTNFSPGKAKDDHLGTYAGGGTGTTFGGASGQSGGGGFSPGGMNSPSGSGFGGSSHSGLGTGSSFGGSAGMSGGGGFSPGGMGSPSGSGFGGASPSASGNSGGLGGPNSNNSGNNSSGGGKKGGTSGKGGGYSSGASKGSTGGL